MKSLILLALGCSLVGAAQNKNPFIDLTYAMNNETVVWPGRKITFNVEFEGETGDGIFIASRGFCTSEHTATHIDAPYHFHKEGKKLHQIDLEDLIDKPGVLIDIYDKVHKVGKDGKLEVLENYVLTKQDIMDWERKNGAIPPGSVVLLRTGWGERWPDVKLFRGHHKDSSVPKAGEDSGNPEIKVGDLDLNFPGFDASAAKYLSVERQVLGVGIDCISIDSGANARFFPAHQIFAKRSVWMLEMVANLHLLPARDFNLWVVPFKIDQGTGAPTRVLARLNRKDRHGSNNAVQHDAL